MEEQWLPWSKNEAYQISNLGNIKGAKGFVLKTQVDNRGYVSVNLRKKGERNANRYCVHILVIETFNPKGRLNESYVVDHIDGNKNNNALTNLRWVTKQENNELKTQNRKPINDIINTLINQYGYQETLQKLQTLLN